jgi:strictosidine synthase-like protein
MLRKVVWTMATLMILVIFYFVAWPVPVEPVAWEAPPNRGYTGPFAPNEWLKGIETLAIGDNHGPEDIAVDGEGRIYASTREGRIVRL